MGIFDFLFKKEQKRDFSSYSGKTEIKQKRNSELKKKLISLMENENNNRSYFNPNRGYDEHLNFALDAYEVASGNLSVENANTSLKLNDDFILNNFLELVKYESGYISEDIKTTILGWIKIYIYTAVKKLQYHYDVSSNLNGLASLFSNVDNEKVFELDIYFLSYLLEEVSEYSFKGKLFFLIELYKKSNEKYLEKLKEEILDLAVAANKISEKENLYFFDTREEIQEFMEIRKAQLKFNYPHLDIMQKDLYHNKSYEDILFSNFSPDKSYLLLLYLYSYIFKSRNELKELINNLIKKTNISHTTFQAVLLILLTYYKASYNSYYNHNSFILNLAKKYLKDKPLDQKSYEKLKEAAGLGDTLPQVKAINNFLYSKKESLQDILVKDVFHLLHSGVFADIGLGHDISLLGSKTKYSKIVNELVLLLSQVVPTILIKEPRSKGYYTLKLGTMEFELKKSNLSSLNDMLFIQNIPFQLIAITKGISKYTKHSNQYYNIVLVNQDEYNSLQSLKNGFNFNINESYGKLNFVDIDTSNFSVSNDIKTIKKNRDKVMSVNRFINDINWKDVKSNIVDHFPNKLNWYKIMHQIVSYSGNVSPSASWRKKLQDEVSKISSEEFELGMDRLIYDAQTNALWFNKANIKALRGLIWANTLLSEDDASDKLEALLLKSYQKIENVGPRSISGGSSCIAALVYINSEESYKILYNLEKNTTYERFKNELKAALYTFEKQSPQMIIATKESMIDDFQFKNGKKIMLIESPYYVQWIIEDGKAKSHWTDREGKRLTTAPKINNIQSRKTIVNTTRAINNAINEITDRLKKYRYSEISFTYKQWKNNYIHHNLVQLLIENHLWIIERKESENIVFITRNQNCLDLEDKTIVFEDEDKIRHFNQFLVSEETNRDWINYFIQNQITPKLEYFYGKAKTIEECENILNEIYSTIDALPYGSDWNSIGGYDLKAKARDFDLLQKSAVFSLEKDTDGKNRFKITYHNLPLKKKSYDHYTLKELGKPVNQEDISEKQKIEFYNEIITIIGSNYKNSVSDNQKLLIIPKFRFWDKVFKEIENNNIFNNYKYDNFEITISGEKNIYLIPVLEKNNIYIKERENNSYIRFYDKFVPTINFPLLLKMPFVSDIDLNRIFYFIEQLTNDTNTRNSKFKNWINIENRS